MIETDESVLAERIERALEAWPVPVDVSPDLVRHLARTLAVEEAPPERVAGRNSPQRQRGGNLEPPCNHRDDFIGTVEAGDFRTGPHHSVSTCGLCANRSAGFVELMTGEKAKPLLTFKEAREQQAQRRSR